jgi:hypothetical protein
MARSRESLRDAHVVRESNISHGGNVWFAFDESRPLAFVAGVWTNWTFVRKAKEGETSLAQPGGVCIAPAREAERDVSNSVSDVT